eukprot:5060142-Amphidinium_carterae.1
MNTARAPACTGTPTHESHDTPVGQPTQLSSDQPGTSWLFGHPPSRPRTPGEAPCDAVWMKNTMRTTQHAHTIRPYKYAVNDSERSVDMRSAAADPSFPGNRSVHSPWQLLTAHTLSVQATRFEYHYKLEQTSAVRLLTVARESSEHRKWYFLTVLQAHDRAHAEIFADVIKYCMNSAARRRRVGTSTSTGRPSIRSLSRSFHRASPNPIQSARMKPASATDPEFPSGSHPSSY